MAKKFTWTRLEWTKELKKRRAGRTKEAEKEEDREDEGTGFEQDTKGEEYVKNQDRKARKF